MAKQIRLDGLPVTDESDLPPDHEPAERLRKVPGKVDDQGLEIIQGAISLKRATLAYRNEWISDGNCLMLICIDWTKAESARLAGKGV